MKLDANEHRRISQKRSSYQIENFEHLNTTEKALEHRASSSLAADRSTGRKTFSMVQSKPFSLDDVLLDQLESDLKTKDAYNSSKLVVEVSDDIENGPLRQVDQIGFESD